MQKDLSIPEDDPRRDRDPREPIQPPGADDPEDPMQDQPRDEPEDSPSRGEPERRDPGMDEPVQHVDPGKKEPWS